MKLEDIMLNDKSQKTTNYTWHLNNTSFNCVGPLIVDFFQ